MRIRRKKLELVLSALAITICIAVMTSYYVSPVLLYVNEHGWNPEYYNTLDIAEQISKGYKNEVGLGDIVPLEGGVPEIAKFYNDSITDNYTTIGFYNARLLAYWTDRPFVDLCWPYGYQSILPILQENDSTKLINELYKSNIRYFLIPKLPTGQYQGWAAPKTAWDYYSNLLNKTVLFQEINKNKYFMPVKEFTFYTLFKLLTPSEYDSSLLYEAATQNFTLTNVSSNITVTSEAVSLSANVSQNVTNYYGVSFLTSPLETTTDNVTLVMKYSMTNAANLYDLELWSLKDGKRSVEIAGYSLGYSASAKVLTLNIPAEVFSEPLYLGVFIRTVTSGDYGLDLFYLGIFGEIN